MLELSVRYKKSDKAQSSDFKPLYSTYDGSQCLSLLDCSRQASVILLILILT